MHEFRNEQVLWIPLWYGDGRPVRHYARHSEHRGQKPQPGVGSDEERASSAKKDIHEIGLGLAVRIVDCASHGNEWNHARVPHADYVTAPRHDCFDRRPVGRDVGVTRTGMALMPRLMEAGFAHMQADEPASPGNTEAFEYIPAPL